MKFRIFLIFLLGSSGCNQPEVRTLPNSDALVLPPAAAESQPPASFDGLAELLTAALQANPALAAREAAWTAAKARIEISRGYPDPSLGLAGFISPLETRNGPTVARLSLRQALPWPSELNALEDGATAQAAAEFCRWESQSLVVQQQLKQAWWELAFTHAAIDLVQQSLGLVITTERILHAKLEVGRTSFANVVRIEVERAILEDQLQSYHDRLNPLRGEIYSLIGVRDQVVEWPIPSLPVGVMPVTPDSIPSAPSPRHPDLLVSAYLQLAAQSALELAKVQAWPKMTVGVEWTVIGDGPAVAPDSGQDALAASINLSLPLHQKRYAGARREAQAKINQHLQTQRGKELSLRAGLAEAAFEIRDAERRISLYREQLGPKTERGFEAALSAFESGSESFETLLDTLRLLLDFQVASARAEADRAQALSKVEQLFGQPISFGPSQPEGSKTEPSASIESEQNSSKSQVGDTHE